MAPGSGNRIKLSVGKILIQINTEILELMAEYKKVKSGVSLSTKGAELEKAVTTKKEALEAQVEAATVEKLYKTTKMIKNNMKQQVK